MTIKVKEGNKKQTEEFAKQESEKFNKAGGCEWKDKAFHFLAYENKTSIGHRCFKINGGALYLERLIISRR